MRKALVLVASSIAMLALGGSGRAALIDVGWVPNSAGLPPFPTKTDADARFLNPTRRIVAQPSGRFLLGHSIFGLYQSVPGFGWTSLTPNCLSLVRPPLIEDLSGLLSGCGVEGIALDPQDPLTAYVSTYNIDILDPSIPVTPGGVFKAEVALGSARASTGGLLWHKLLGGVRGNALALKRPSPTQPATIVAGRIQKRVGDVGTDDNAACRAVARADNCSPSVYVSTNDGKTWTPKYFEPAPCANGQGNVTTSSRIVGNLAFDPASNNVVYAGANSGLWYSTDSGGSWHNALAICNTNPGFAITEGRDGSGARRIYVGTADGRILRASAGAAGPGAFTEIARGIPAQILTVMLDRRDDSERTLFVASWGNVGPTGGGTGGIRRVTDLNNGGAQIDTLDDSLLDFIGPLGDAPLPYPLTQDPRWRPSLFLAQNPLDPDLLSVSTVLGGVWTRNLE